MSATVHYFGIRHHGPGSAARLLDALNALQPACVLIEGPADCTDILGQLARAEMQLPVALLAYCQDDPATASYWPFAEFSPEYQACLWAVANGAELRFIDLPVSQQLAMALAAREQDSEDGPDGGEQEAQSPPAADKDPVSEAEQETPLSQDPIAELARLSGYQDGEAWWNDLIEQNADDDAAIFDSVASAMAALRGSAGVRPRDLQREAHMRLEIAQAAKASDGPIAVVCGAWHVPALNEKHKISADKALLKALPKKLAAAKVRATWVPWTSPRLASRSGYGAGVDAPQWYQHLWQHRSSGRVLESWLTKTAAALRQQGQVVSTASVIEAVRLSRTLATVRQRPAAGFEEMREAAIACLCFGEPLQWQGIEDELLLGSQVGAVPPDSPLLPLLEDLEKQKKALRLKAEASSRELSLDLRTEPGLLKSILLHRLTLLDVPWGLQTNAGGSRGTFRERWLLCWQPEFSVRLVENLVYGSTIAQAANACLAEKMQGQSTLAGLTELVQLGLEADLLEATAQGLKLLDSRAAHTDDCSELLAAVPSLVQIQRYGTARQLSASHLDALLQRLVVQASVSLPYACRNLNDEEAGTLGRLIEKSHDAIQLAQLDDAINSGWFEALGQVAEHGHSSPALAGLANRLLYFADIKDAASVQAALQVALSPAIATAEAARFFEGFFTGATQQLLYDSSLLETVTHWLSAMDEEAFIAHVPLLRRVFSGLDAMERRRLMDTVLHGRQQGLTLTVNSALGEQWQGHLQRLGKLIQRDKTWTQTPHP